ncbi:hypothetical protein C477_18390 [Haloterrigena salina JCM 13891]|uniref:Uncharacterized protein n=1 Tax=Haloterrigena salina JCM 13891 TaxID=1227488 RepID=M0BZS4_9EURY|nr:hypothetical protein [Haloterrigena salina]ELZ15184.1 hypothetical protein C477_18390 [Haloterrigena salina JCM 13891]
MTSRDWQADRCAVFDRDDHACRNCETTGDDADSTALRTYPVGAVPLEGTVHESSLATVCPDCFETLQFASDAPDSTPESVSSEELFRLVRETTRVQGGAISDVASFASLATSLPTTLAAVGTAADAGDDSESTVAETAAAYRDGRREALLALDVADARLERVRAVDGTAFDADVRSSLSTVAETATDLQSTLREAVVRSEIVPVCLERCHGCFEPLEGEDETCSTCGLEARETGDWRGGEGEIAFERLFSSINDSLQGASTTTETLTDRTMTLASQLTES